MTSSPAPLPPHLKAPGCSAPEGRPRGAAFAMEPPPPASVGAEPMTLGSPTSPKPGAGAQFLPGFLMGDLPAPATPQPRSLSGPSVGVMEMRSPLLAGGSPPQPVIPAHKDKGGAPPVRSIYDEVASPGLGSTPLTSRRPASFSVTQSPTAGSMPTTPGTVSGVFSPASLAQPRKTTMSPAQLDPFYTQGDALTSEDHLDDTWVTVFGFPQESASYILLQFAQYGNILKHVMSNTGNWMHIHYQSKLQARKALSKDGRIFGESIMIGVKPCIDKVPRPFPIMGTCQHHLPCLLRDHQLPQLDHFCSLDLGNSPEKPHLQFKLENSARLFWVMGKAVLTTTWVLTASREALSCYRRNWVAFPECDGEYRQKFCVVSFSLHTTHENTRHPHAAFKCSEDFYNETSCYSL